MSCFPFSNYLLKNMGIDETFKLMGILKAGNFDYGNASNGSVIIYEQHASASLGEGGFFANTLTYSETMFFLYCIEW